MGDMFYLKKVDPQTPAGRDPTYHYEEMKWKALKYGIWEIPGSDVMIRQWPMFYRYVRMSACLFVVDAHSDKKFDEIEKSRYWLQYLLNEDELRCAAFVLVLNIRPQEKTPQKDNAIEENVILEMLGVPEILA